MSMVFGFVGMIDASGYGDIQEPGCKRSKVEQVANVVTLYHKLRQADHLPSVKQSGLFSFPQAYERNLTDCDGIPKNKLDRRKQDVDIYFSPINDRDCEIAYQTPTNNLFVFNGAYRKYGEWVSYNQSKISLKHYLQAIEKMNKLQQQYPNALFHLHPISCLIQVVAPKNTSSCAISKKIQSKRVQAYDPEVVESAGRIPPEQLTFLK